MNEYSLHPEFDRSQILPRSLVALSLLLAVGCSHQNGLHREYFEPEKGGILRFDGSLAEFRDLKNSERLVAVKMAQRFCRGPIKILKAGTEFVEAAATRSRDPSPDVADPDEYEAAQTLNTASSSAAASQADEKAALSVTGSSMSVQGQSDSKEVFVQFRCAVQGKK